MSLSMHFQLFQRARVGSKRATRQWHVACFKKWQDLLGSCGEEWPPTIEHAMTFVEGLESSGLKQSSKNGYARGMQAFFNWCVRAGHLVCNPLSLVAITPAPKPIPRAAQLEDVYQLLDTIQQAECSWRTARDTAIFALALDSGVRIGELASIHVLDLDLCNKRIRVNGTKTNKQRFASVSTAAISHLNDWLVARRQLGVDRIVTNLFISNHQGQGYRPFTDSGIRQCLYRWQDKAGVGHFTMHSLRHACAVYSLQNGASLLDVRDQLGHKSITTTAIYTQITDAGRAERHQQTSPLLGLDIGDKNR